MATWKQRLWGVGLVIGVVGLLALVANELDRGRSVALSANTSSEPPASAIEPAKSAPDTGVAGNSASPLSVARHSQTQGVDREVARSVPAPKAEAERTDTTTRAADFANVGSGAKALSLIEEYRREPNPILRRERLRTWADEKRPNLYDVALLAVRDDDPTLVLQGVSILAALKEKRLAPLLLRLLEENRRRPDGYGPPIREAVVLALGACGDPAVVPLLVRDLDAHDDFSYDQTIVKALGDIGAKSALPAIDRQIAWLEAHKPTEAIALGPWRDAMNTAREARRQIERQSP